MRITLLTNIVLVIAGILRLLVLFLFVYLANVHIKRYLEEGVYTKINRFPLSLPNMTFCQSNIESLNFSDPDRSSGHPLANASNEEVFRFYKPFVDDFTVCIGGSGVRKQLCESNSGKTMGDWYHSPYEPGVHCLTYRPRYWYFNSRSLTIEMGHHLYPGENSTYMLVHVGPRGPVVPGQNTATLNVFRPLLGKTLYGAIQVWEFKRITTHEAYCVDTAGYEKKMCETSCRWDFAALSVGCRGKWQLNLDEQLNECNSSYLGIFHRAFLNTSSRLCESKCLEPCLNRDLVIVQRFYEANENNKTSVVLQFASSTQQVEEFVRFDSDRLMSAIGGNIGLLLGISGLAVVDLVSALLSTMWNTPRGERRAACVHLFTIDIHQYLE